MANQKPNSEPNSEPWFVPDETIPNSEPWFVSEGWDKLRPDLQHYARPGHFLGRMPWFYANGWNTLPSWHYKFATPHVAVVDSHETVLLGAQTQWAFKDACFAIKRLLDATDGICVRDKIVGAHLLFSTIRFYRHDVWKIHHNLWVTILNKVIEFQRDPACGDVSQWLRAVLGMVFVGISAKHHSEPPLIEFKNPTEVPDAIEKFVAKCAENHKNESEESKKQAAKENAAKEQAAKEKAAGPVRSWVPSWVPPAPWNWF